MKNKLVIVINGRSGVGKDALCLAAASAFRVRNVSSIDPIREISKKGGWDGITKDESVRKLWIKLKEAFVEYNDLPIKYLQNEFLNFLTTDEQIMFVHIREPQEIKKFRKAVPCKTILVTRPVTEVLNLENDDNVTKFEYDYLFDNSAPLEKSGKVFVELLKNIFSKEAL